jgi:hypothetical protein
MEQVLKLNLNNLKHAELSTSLFPKWPATFMHDNTMHHHERSMEIWFAT